ncbi:MAG: SGNH/GDSL hydrolase family protein [Inquilinaceae bacterium]
MIAPHPKIRLRGLCTMLACLPLLACGGGALDEERLSYLAVGASDAAGIGAIPPTDGYVFLIRDALADRGRDVTLLNLGIPAANTDLLRDTVDTTVEAGARPALVTVWVGANDIIAGIAVEKFEVELEAILAAVQDRSDPLIVIANIPDLTELPRFERKPEPTVTEDRVEAFNEVIEDLADEYDAILVGLFDEGIEDDLVSDIDGFHPNNDGHRRIAEEFLDVILDEL